MPGHDSDADFRIRAALEEGRRREDHEAWFQSERRLWRARGGKDSPTGRAHDAVAQGIDDVRFEANHSVTADLDEDDLKEAVVQRLLAARRAGRLANLTDTEATKPFETVKGAAEFDDADLSRVSDLLLCEAAAQAGFARLVRLHRDLKVEVH